MAPDGTISDKHGWSDVGPDAQFLLGMDRFEARQAIVEWFRKRNLLEDVREYAHEIGHSYRSHVPIEPYLSDQWYIAVKKPIEYLSAKFGEGLIEGTDVPVNSLAGLALKPLLDGRLRFIPERYAKTYQSWLENLRDWPISRQLWWGHRIPIWYCQRCGQVNTGLEDPTSCENCGGGDFSNWVGPVGFTTLTPARINFSVQPMGIGGYDLAVVDMNGDHLDDIVSVSSTNVNIHFQQSGGGFSEEKSACNKAAA